MKNLTKQLTLAVFTIILIFSVTSCMEDLDPGEIAHGDAFIRAYWDGDSVIYNTELYTYSGYEMKTVTAYSSDDTTNVFTLSYNNYKYTFSYVPERSTFSTTVPAATRYYFDVVLENGQEHTAIDYLDTAKVTPPVVSELAWDETAKRINIAWNDVEDADYYRVLLLNDEKEIVYDTDLLYNSKTSLSISAFSSGWYSNKQPTKNSMYQVLVYAYLFEPLATTFDLQCIAVNDLNTIEWMPEQTGD